MLHYTKHLAILALTALLGILPLRAGVSINRTNFPDDNFRAWLLNEKNILGYGKDGYLTDLEISKITSISPTSQSITSLKGIEYFTEMTFLNCFYNQLTELDVTKNTALIYLYCNNNKLTSLDVSTNTALTYLHCYGNQLTELDVSANTALTYLHCYGNQLTELDVSANTALTNLSCGGNQLTELDVSHNTALTYLVCNSNKLTELSISQNTSLTELYISGNPLTSSPDLSHNTALKTLQCASNNLLSLDVSHNTALTDLNCYSNQLTELDVSKNSELTILKCSCNWINELNVKSNPMLTELDCSQNKLTELDCSQNTSLKTLRCYNNEMESLNVRGCTLLTYLNCGYNSLNGAYNRKDNHLTLLDLSTNVALKELYLIGIGLTKLDLSNNIALTKLYCYSNQLTDLDVTYNTALTTMLCSSNQLTELDVSKNTALTALACDYNQLVELDLSENSLLNTNYNNGFSNKQNRNITAEVGWTGVNNQKLKFYYLSLDGLAGHGHEMQTLAQKLLVDDHADEWWSRVNKETMTGATLIEGKRKAATADDIDPQTVYGKILVLNPTIETEIAAAGSITYAYDMKYTGTSTSVQQASALKNFTLTWRADPQVVTDLLRLGDGIEVPVSEVQFVNPAGQSSDRPWQGVNIVVTRYSDGTTETSKVLR